MRRALGFLPALALALVVGCAAAAQQDVSCADDTVCPGSLVCAFGRCIDPNDQRLTTVDVEIDPSMDGVPVQSVLGVDLRASPRVDVALAPGVFVTGTVALAGEEEPEGVSALVVARPDVSIPGRVLAPTASSGADGSFSLLLVEEQRYSVIVMAEDRSLPPLYEDDGFTADGGTSGEQSLDPLLLSRGQVAVTGRVRAGEGVAEQGIEKLDVRLVDDDGRIWSSTSRTGADGTFALALREGRTDLTLEVLPTPENDAFPSLRVVGVDASADIDLGPISLGHVLAPVRFEARVVDASGAPLPGARLVLRAEVGAGLYERQTDANDDGTFDLSLPPGSYDAAVFGGPEDDGGGLLFVSDIDVPAANTDLVFRLPPRVAYGGRVLDADGAPVSGATVELVRLGDEDGVLEEPLAEVLVAFAVVADDAGRFSAVVDPGRYRVSTRPPPGSKAPAFSELVTVPAEGLERNVDLPQRAVVVGTAVFDGEPVGNAYVRVFSALLDERGAAILLGQGAAGPDGAFEIVVPDLVGDVAELPAP